MNSFAFIYSVFVGVVIFGVSVYAQSSPSDKNSYYTGPTPYVYEAHKLYKIISEYVGREFNWHMAGAGGRMMNGIHELELSFQSARELTEEEVVNDFKKLITFICNKANENEIIREACDNHQMTPKMLDLFLVIKKGEGNSNFDTARYFRKKIAFEKHWYSEYRSELIREVDLE